MEFTDAIDEPGMWSDPTADEGLHLRVLCCVEGEFVGTRIKRSTVGEDDALGVSADIGVGSQVVIPEVESCMGGSGSSTRSARW